MSETSEYESYEYETESGENEETTSEEETSSEYASEYETESSSNVVDDAKGAVTGAIGKVTGGKKDASSSSSSSESSSSSSESSSSYEYYETSSADQGTAVVKNATSNVTRAVSVAPRAVAAPVAAIAAAAPVERQIIQHSDGTEDLHRWAPKRLMAELVGTFTLCFVIYMARATLADKFDTDGSGAPAGGLVGVALAHAFVLTAMAASFGSTSGGHFNPAVTWAFMITGEINFWVGVAYTAIQCTAGVVAGALAFGLMRQEQLNNVDEFGKFRTPGIHYAAPIACAFDVGIPEDEWVDGVYPVCDLKAFGAETMGTFFLLITIFMAGVAGHGSHSAYIAIGLALGMGVLATGPISNACLNPARALGAAAFSHNFLWRSFWVWVIGPLIASIVAGLLFAIVFQSRHDNSWGVGGFKFWKTDADKRNY